MRRVKARGCGQASGVPQAGAGDRAEPKVGPPQSPGASTSLPTPPAPAQVLRLSSLWGGGLQATGLRTL